MTVSPCFPGSPVSSPRTCLPLVVSALKTSALMFSRLLLLAALLMPAVTVRAQSTPQDTLTLAIDEAIQMALLNAYAIQNAKLDLEDGNTRVSQGIGSILPNISLVSGYTRNLETANPFIGSSAGSFFNTFGYIGWLSYNEVARTDDDPRTRVMTYTEYSTRVFQGMQDAGLTFEESDNPFAVANQFQNTITFSQTLVDLGKFRTIPGLQYLKRSLESALTRQEQLVVGQVREAFYRTLLLQHQSGVAAQSVARTRRTLHETTRRVAQGVAPMAQRLSTEVQLANLETQWVQTRNEALTALDNLKFLLAIPVDQPVRLSGTLEADVSTSYLTVSAASAFEQAVNLRPDLQQVEAMRELTKMNLGVEQRSRFPTLNAVANAGYIGAVPASRTFGIADADNPFRFTKMTNDFFSDAYWDYSVSVGLSLRWTLFEGFSRRARIQQLKIQLNRAEMQVRSTTESIRLEVAVALRNLESARSQIVSQEKNTANAELNYRFAQARLSEGVGTPLEERDASAQLDQSRINYLQAIYNFMVAQSAFETASGIPLEKQSDFQLTHSAVR